ncbi:SOCS box domain-containing protein [Trichonephila inaurata madagascariensis]|uniref:SOCS box domain-containing protein n=1 Tax=Trichonephila inaurata madagascariensis TaxID=2747483 RepID=A0A8X6YHA8_9ARAC|nr:SOCS box domain-containing protein [Trichonephila inaurata madagascariensis]GFY70875.1 SOCS box domain-containing protein [Trichonephila inaurata madagascariensis]
MYRFSHHFHGWQEQVEFSIIILKQAVDVVRYGFIAQKSATYLDLSICEYTNCEKLLHTKEAFKKRILENRRIIYVYNLDICNKVDDEPPKIKVVSPSGLAYSNDSTVKSPYVVRYDTNCYYLKEVHVSYKDVYNRGLVPFILNIVKQSTHKTREAIRYLQMMHAADDRGIFQSFLDIICNEREDSNVVFKFLTSHSYFLSHIFLYMYKPSQLEFALYHANKMKSSLWCKEEIFSWKLIVLSGDFRCMSSLIKYGYNFPFFGKEYFNIMKERIEHCVSILGRGFEGCFQ